MIYSFTRNRYSYHRISSVADGDDQFYHRALATNYFTLAVNSVFFSYSRRYHRIQPETKSDEEASYVDFSSIMIVISGILAIVSIVRNIIDLEGEWDSHTSGKCFNWAVSTDIGPSWFWVALIAAMTLAQILLMIRPGREILRRTPKLCHHWAEELGSQWRSTLTEILNGFQRETYLAPIAPCSVLVLLGICIKRVSAVGMALSRGH